MPLPKPQSDETRSEFVQRCMIDDTMLSEFEFADQRYAVCSTIYGDDQEEHYEDEDEGERDTVEFLSANITTEVKYQTLDTRLEIKALGEEGYIEGYGSVFGNVDFGGDVVRRGAFSKTLKERPKVRMLWQHEWNKPIGVWEEMREDGYGLYMKGRINLETQQGRECYALLKQGAMDGLSIGFTEINSFYDEKGYRNITEVMLYEVSVVTLPMNEAASVMVVKNNGFTPKNDELKQIADALRKLTVQPTEVDEIKQSLMKFFK